MLCQCRIRCNLIIGYGRIGREVAERAAGLKCRVLASITNRQERYRAQWAAKMARYRKSDDYFSK